MKKIKIINLLFSFIISLIYANTAVAEQEKVSLGIAYEVKIVLAQHKLKNKEIQIKSDLSSLENLLLKVSEAHRLESKPPMSLLIINRRAESDVKSLQKALRSRAYYAATISYKIDKKNKPIRLEYLVHTGEQYVFDNVELKLAGNIGKHKLLKIPSAKEIGLIPQTPADARDVLKAEKKLIFELKKQSFAYAKLTAKTFTVDHSNKTMQISFEIDPGPSVHFGATQFVGMTTVDEIFLQSLISWKINQRYRPRLLKETTNNVAERDLFSTIRIELVPPHDFDKQKLNSVKEMTVPVIVHLKERLHRSIKANVGFDTDTGFTIGGQWTHRNYFGAGEKLSVKAAWTGVGPLVDIRFNKPSFYHPNQSFLASLKLQNEDTDAYESSSLSMGVAIERSFIKDMKLSIGLAFKQSSITDKSIDSDLLATEGQEIDSSQNFSLFYMPVKFTWDYSDDLFEPEKGGKILLQGAPFIDVQSDLMFTKIFATYIHYLKLMDDPKFILAGRMAVGQITGADAYEIPADERFYSGGGGSVRGYSYQLIGPLDKNNNPLGGNALLEFALESRINFTQTIGGVIFVDAGSAFSSSFFDGSSDLLYGAGLGLRYSSPMGPLRADVAIPVDRRDGVDDAFQIYLSIGQAF